MRSVETRLETDPKAADSILNSMPQPKSNRDRALYAVLKTQAEYKQYKPITSDSLILTATRYYGTNRKNYHAALAWYTQGCVYTELHDDVQAIDAYLKAKDLFPDTLVRYYALTEQVLGRRYLTKTMYDDSYRAFTLSRNNASRIKDSTMIAYSDYNIAIIKLQKNNYNGLNKAFCQLSENKYLSDFYRGECLLQLAKYHIYGSCLYDSALYYLDRKIEQHKVSLGATYNLKGETYYLLGCKDSAYHYFQLSLKERNDIYTLCDSYRRLSELGMLYSTSQEAYNYSTLFTECLDSIRVLRNANDVAKVELSHRSEINDIKNREYHIRIIIISSMIVIVMLIVLLLLHKSRINRVNTDYIQFCDKVWTQINTTINSDSTEKDRFLIGRTKYMNSPSHSILFNKPSDYLLTRNEKEAIKHDIGVAFSDLIIFMLDVYPSINTKEIYLCILNALETDRHTACEILVITDENYRTMKSRLKDKIGDSYSIYFG